jgi:predicted O-methyltransferase YrrM
MNASYNWLANMPRLSEIYQATEGPYGSPDPFECWMLYSLALCSNGPVVEIGSWRGRSSCFLAEALNPRGLEPICIDWFQGDTTGGAGAYKGSMQDALNRLALRAKIIDIDMHEMDWSTIKGCDLVFYDSDHQAEPTVSVIGAMHEHLANDAIVVLHDADWPMTRSAVEQLTTCGKFRQAAFIEIWCGLQILQKNG